MSRLFTLERSTVLSAMAIALAVAMFPPAGNLRAEDAAKDEATAEQAAGDGASSPGFAEDLSNRAQDLRSADPGAKSEPEAQSAAQPDTPKSETADSPETPAPQTEAAETPSPAAPAQDASQAAEAKPGDVTPAAAKTAIFDQMTQQHIDFMLSKIPRGRFLKVEELASLVAWMASEECLYTTGAVFDISGGRATY